MLGNPHAEFYHHFQVYTSELNQRTSKRMHHHAWHTHALHVAVIWPTFGWGAQGMWLGAAPFWRYRKGRWHERGRGVSPHHSPSCHDRTISIGGPIWTCESYRTLDGGGGGASRAFGHFNPEGLPITPSHSLMRWWSVVVVVLPWPSLLLWCLSGSPPCGLHFTLATKPKGLWGLLISES